MRWRAPGVLLFICCLHAYAQVNTPKRLGDFFQHPESLCSALQDNGIHTSTWRAIGAGFGAHGVSYSFPSPFVCEYPQWTPATPATVRGAGTPDYSVLYRVSGDTVGRADIITIAVTVFRPESMLDAAGEFKRDIQLLFKSIHRQMPSGLMPSVDRHLYYRSRQPYGLVAFRYIVPDRTYDTKPGQRVLRFRLWQ